MEQAERLCERVCLISRSRKVLDDDLKELKRRERSGVVAVEFDGEAPSAATWPGVSEVEESGDAFHLSLHDGVRPEEILGAVLSEGVSLRRFELLEPRLHEIFVRHAGEPADDDAPSQTGGAS